MESKGKIAVVDDEFELMSALTEGLNKSGYTAKGFISGKEAISAIEKEEFDLIITDLMMPEIDGIQILKKSMEIYPNIVGIIMTGQGAVHTAVEAMQIGAFDYVLKPFKLKGLLPTIERAFDIRRLRTENFTLRETIAIQKLSEAFSKTLDEEEILNILLESVIKEMNTYEVSIMLKINDKSYEMIVAKAYGDISITTKGKRVDKNDKILNYIISNMKPFVSDSKANDMKAFIAMPMISGGKLIGIISINSTNKSEFTNGQIKALSVLSQTSATALENARLFREAFLSDFQASKRLKRISSLRAIDMAITSSLDIHVTLDVLLNHVTEQLHVDAAAILLFNQHLNTLEYSSKRGFNSIFKTDPLNVISIGKGYAGKAAIERKPIMILEFDSYQFKEEQFIDISSENFINYYAIPLIAKGQIKGVLEIFKRSSFEIDDEWFEFLDALARQAAIAIDNSYMLQELYRANTELFLAYDATIEGWSKAMDLRDKETEGHSKRVTELSIKIARELSIGEFEIVNIRRGALLHDMGKMGIPDSILLKPTSLTEEEWKIMKKHPDYAYDMLSPISYLRAAIEIPYCHHEKWNGTGYPRGLKNDAIPISARIFAIADVWDALTSDRPYRKAWPKEKTLAIIQEQSNKHFDPKVVEAFLKIDLNLE